MRALEPVRCLVVSGLVLLAATACGTPAASPATTPATPAASTDFERFFPLEEGKIYNYVTKDGGDSGMLVAKVHRTDKTHGELRLSNATKRFVLAQDGVAYDDPSSKVGVGAYILKGPLEVGVSWTGEHGGSTRIAATDVAVDVPAGHYASCVRTVEDGGRPPNSRYETTYCPGIGMVLLVVTAPGAEARAELKSYGMPVKIE